MKNLHVLPTDHPSRLRYNIKTRIWELNEFHKYHTDIKSTHNIYVTSEEHIKEGDWYLDTSMKTCDFAVNKYNFKRLETIAKQFKNSFKKIILTTDRDLIEDRVQPIYEEFLEWFVKNSSCDEIEIKHIIKEYVDDQDAYGYDVNYYTIITPKEESKTNLEKLLFPELVAELAGYYKNTQLVEEPKQELDCPYNFTSRCTIGRCDCKPKEVVEKTTKMYSEEEVKTIINDIVEKHCTYFSQGIKDGIKLEWFKKFKK